jgi:hypothetical protein
VFTTSGTYPWSFVTHIFHNGQPSHDGPIGNLGSVASLLASTIYQGNPDRVGFPISNTIFPDILRPTVYMKYDNFSHKIKKITAMSKATFISLAHIYMPDDFPGLVQALRLKKEAMLN